MGSRRHHHARLDLDRCVRVEVDRALAPVLEDRSDSADEGTGLGPLLPEGGTWVQTDVFGSLEHLVATGEHGQARDIGEVHMLVADVP